MKKVLLDEHLPHGLRPHLSAHNVFTVAYMGWAAFRNGNLMTRAEADGFDVIVTMDEGFQHQRPSTAPRLAIVRIEAPTNTLDELLPLVPAITHAIDAAVPGSLTVVQ